MMMMLQGLVALGWVIAVIKKYLAHRIVLMFYQERPTEDYRMSEFILEVF